MEFLRFKRSSAHPSGRVNLEVSTDGDGRLVVFVPPLTSKPPRFCSDDVASAELSVGVVGVSEVLVAELVDFMMECKRLWK
jgi:hypothetical protein